MNKGTWNISKRRYVEKNAKNKSTNMSYKTQTSQEVTAHGRPSELASYERRRTQIRT